MKLRFMAVLWWIAVVAILIIIFSDKVSGAHTEKSEVSPDLMVTFGCFQEEPVLNLAHIFGEKGKYWFDEVADQYLQTGECFILYDPGYPAYVDRVVKKTSYQFEGEDAYVVEAHFLGAAEGKKFFFLYHGELPTRAQRSAA